jgi:molybdate transport system substrate-binding protein
MRRAAWGGVAVGLVVVGVAALFWSTRSGRTPESQAGRGAVRVAAAADLKFALDDALKAFQARQPDIDVQVTYGASGNFFAQLSNRAPFDLFLSADVDYPRKLVEQGLADRESEFLYAVGHLVVWVPGDSPLDVEKQGAQVLLDPSVRKVAIANPRHAPYGRAAEAALKSLGVYDQVQDRLVLGENVAQAAQFAETGAADAGVFALSLALATALRDKGRYWEVPLDAYPRLEQGGVILSWAEDRPAAEQLRSFLLGAEGKAVLRRYGFFLPGE